MKRAENERKTGRMMKWWKQCEKQNTKAESQTIQVAQKQSVKIVQNIET